MHVTFTKYRYDVSSGRYPFASVLSFSFVDMHEMYVIYMRQRVDANLCLTVCDEGM